MENRVKILIADGNEEFCDHVKRRLEQVPGYEIVGTAADGQRAAELMRVTKPDILVLDLMLSKLDGIAVLKRAREMDKPPAALVLTGFMTEYVANMAASLGVQYFMTKPCELDAVAERIHEMTAIDGQLRQSAQRRRRARADAGEQPLAAGKPLVLRRHQHTLTHCFLQRLSCGVQSLARGVQLRTAQAALIEPIDPQRAQQLAKIVVVAHRLTPPSAH